MSILMDALKQQHPTLSAMPVSSMWRNLALVLALLLALVIGAVAGYFLLPILQPSLINADERGLALAEPAVKTPANPEQILYALESSDTIPVDSTVWVNGAKQAQPKTEFLPKQQPMTTVTAPSLPDKANVLTTRKVDAAATKEIAQNNIVVAKDNGQADVAEVDVSAALRDKFSLALQATERNNTVPVRSINKAPAADVSELEFTLRQKIPSLSFEAHVYATTTSQRWVKVNGKTLQENQWVTADIKIKEITPQYVLLELGNALFSMAALSSWQQP